MNSYPINLSGAKIRKIECYKYKFVELPVNGIVPLEAKLSAMMDCTYTYRNNTTKALKSWLKRQTKRLMSNGHILSLPRHPKLKHIT